MRKTIVIFCAVLLSLALPSVASAHTLKTDGAMGAILHILPDDAPIAGITTTYELAFQTDESGFTLQDCDCTVTYIANNETIKVLPLQASSPTTSRNDFSFPIPAVYTVLVSGNPKNNAAFTPFTLRYIVRVGGAERSSQPIPLLLWVGIGMAVILLVLYANTQQYRGKINSKEGS